MLSLHTKHAALIARSMKVMAFAQMFPESVTVNSTLGAREAERQDHIGVRVVFEIAVHSELCQGMRFLRLSVWHDSVVRRILESHNNVGQHSPELLSVRLTHFP